MRLTKKQRAEVVELLRCAADLVVCGNYNSALGSAAFETDTLMPFHPIGPWSYWYSLLKQLDGLRDDATVCEEGYELLLLEAAQRVEEGTWP